MFNSNFTGLLAKLTVTAIVASSVGLTSTAQAGYCSWYQWGCTEPSDEDIRNSARSLQTKVQEKRDETFYNAPKNSATIGATMLRNGSIMANFQRAK